MGNVLGCIVEKYLLSNPSSFCNYDVVRDD